MEDGIRVIEDVAGDCERHGDEHSARLLRDTAARLRSGQRTEVHGYLVGLPRLNTVAVEDGMATETDR